MMIVDLFCNSKEGSYECSTLPFLCTSALVIFLWVSCYHTFVVGFGFCEVRSRNKNLLRNLLKRVRTSGHELTFGHALRF